MRLHPDDVAPVSYGLGLVLAFGVSRVLAQLLEGLSVTAWPLAGTSLAILIGVAAMAAARPIVRAARLDPWTLLRES